MHKIWLFNIEEAVPNIHASEKFLTPFYCRYLWYVETGDLFISMTHLPENFLEYLCEVKNLPQTQEWLIELPYHRQGIAASVLNDTATLNLLKSLAQTGQYRLEPYLETPNIIALAEKTGLACGWTNPALIKEGLIAKLNNKAFFKALSEQLGIKTIPGIHATNMQELTNAILQTCKTLDSLAIIKIAHSSGGHGNLTGTCTSLKTAVKTWYHNDEVIVEPVLDIVETIGSLAVITNDAVRFEGMDCQYINNFSWLGCCYPRQQSHFSSQIEQGTLKYAEHMQAMGARGWLNIDWGIVKTADQEYALVAIESNFRQNGFKFVLDISRLIFGQQDKAYIKHYHAYKLADSIHQFHRLLNQAQKVVVDGKPVLAKTLKASSGVVLLGLPLNNAVGIIIVGDSIDYITKADIQLKEYLNA